MRHRKQVSSINAQDVASDMINKIAEKTLQVVTVLAITSIMYGFAFAMNQLTLQSVETDKRTPECYTREYFEKSQQRDLYRSYKVDCPK